MFPRAVFYLLLKSSTEFLILVILSVLEILLLLFQSWHVSYKLSFLKYECIIPISRVLISLSCLLIYLVTFVYWILALKKKKLVEKVSSSRLEVFGAARLTQSDWRPQESWFTSSLHLFLEHSTLSALSKVGSSLLGAHLWRDLVPAFVSLFQWGCQKQA